MATVSLSNNVIQIDKRLEKQSNITHEELCRHRWHWTLDESNPRRVSIREYAKSVGVRETWVRDQVRGYALWAEGGADELIRSLTDAIERAKLTAESAAAVEAVARANNVAFTTARQKRTGDVRQVRDAVRDKAERDPDADLAEYAGKVAGMVVANRRAEREARAERAASKSRAYIDLSGLLSKARRAVNDALVVARESELDDETTEYVLDKLEKLEAATGLLRLAVAGSIDIDWDAEMIKMGGDLS